MGTKGQHGMRKIDVVLAEVRDLRADTHEGLRAVNSRIDGVHARLDTVIDALADLRSDVDRHTHDS